MRTKKLSKGGNEINKYIKNKLNQEDNIPCLIDQTNKILFNDEKCNILGKSFQKYFLEKQCPINEDNSIIEINTSISDIDLDVGIVWNIIRKLSSRNSTTPDNISYILLKNCADSISLLITDMFRIILDNGQIPLPWKTSIIIPLYKKGEKSDPINYRPISLTCTLCRIYEKCQIHYFIP